jgi:hypothetical protein
MLARAREQRELVRALPKMDFDNRTVELELSKANRAAAALLKRQTDFSLIKYAKNTGIELILKS